MKHTDCIKDLQSAQEAEFDNREMVRECDHFLNKRDGQWQPEVIEKFKGKPRYTLDECNPIVDDILGEMEQMEFDIKVSPASNDATKINARYYEGTIRNIENMCGARFIYNAAARIMVGTGFSAWRVFTDYRDSDSFQQDLMIMQIDNAQDCVWFDENATKQDMSDAEHAWVLTSLTRKKYDEKYPKGSGLSVGNQLRAQVYDYKKMHEVKVGEYLYIKKKSRELALLSDNRVVVIDDDFQRVYDDLQRQGISILDTRTRMANVVYSRKFDGGDWLEGERETVFEYIPIIPVYGNFKISEDKVIYWGITEKLMDPQRIINYSESRKIEEGALSPRGKTWMSKDQAKSVEVRQTLRTLNTNSDPVQFYDHVEGQPPPNYIGSPPSNPGLVETSQSTRAFVQRTSGMFAQAQGQSPTHRSPEAIDKLRRLSDNPKRKWFTSVEIALTHTCRIMVKAIPKVYDTQQKMQLVNRDGTTDEFIMKQKVVDLKTGKTVILNDLSAGKYNVVCTAGPAFHSQQQETVSNIHEIATIDPSVIQLGGDVLLNNINAPGIDQIAQRKRKQMLAQGLIPPEQQTNEEKALLQQQQQQGQKPDPMMIAAQAEMVKAQTKQQESGIKLQLDQQKLQLQGMKLQLDRERDERNAMLEAVKLATEEIKAQAEALKLIREAMGAEAIISPAATGAYQSQARNLRQSTINIKPS